MTNTAQSFVDSLNHKDMPKMGYKLVGGEWKWPVYDWDNHYHSDFESKDYVESQFKRLGRYKFKE